MKRLLTIAGSDSCGGAGLQADLKTFHELGVYGMSVVTAVTAQNTTGVQDSEVLAAELVRRQLTSVLDDIGADGVKTGMLGTSANIRAVAEVLRELSPSCLVVDPVIMSSQGQPLLEGNGLEAFVDELIPLATLVTPNLNEATALAGIPVANTDEMKVAAQVIYGMAGTNVLVKGGHLPGEPVDILFDGEEYFEFVSPRIPGRERHGTGCTYSSAIAVHLALEHTLPEAVELAKAYLMRTLRSELALGSGLALLNHFSADRPQPGA